MKDDTVSRAAVMESLTRESMTIGEIAGVLELVQALKEVLKT